MTMFICGSTMVLGTGIEANQDAWIAVVVAALMAVPVYAVYGRIAKTYPGENIYDIFEIVFGKVLGKTLSLLFVWYSVHLGSLVIRNFSEFVQIVSFPETPQFVMVMFTGLVVIYFLKSGIEVIGRWSDYIIVVIIMFVIIINVLSITQMHIEYIIPILGRGVGGILRSSTAIFAFPFGEAVIFLSVLNNLNENGKPYRIFYISLALGGLIILIASMRNILTLGVQVATTLYFPVYTSISLINIGDFLQRLQVLVTIIYILTGFIKISICIYSACIGFSKVFNIKDYRKIVVPISLVSMSLSCIIYKNPMEMFYWALVIYKYYAFPFQVIIPIILLIGVEIKSRKGKRQAAVSS